LCSDLDAARAACTVPKFGIRHWNRVLTPFTQCERRRRTRPPNASSVLPVENASTGWLILNRRHLERVLRVFVDHYNAHRPHCSLDLTPPVTHERPAASSRELKLRDRLGGLIHEYSYAA